MAWARVDDGWWCHPKVLTLDLTARGLWVSALSWSCHQRRDLVPRQFLTIVGDDGTAAATLVDAGLWLEVDGGWVIHDWAEYQGKSLSEKRAEAGRKGGIASGEARRAGTKQNGKQPANQDDDGNGSDQQEHQQPDEPTAKQTNQRDEADAEAGPSRPFPSLPKPPSHAHTRDPDAPDGQATDDRGDPSGLEDQGQPAATYGQRTIGRLPALVKRRLDQDSRAAIAALTEALAAAHQHQVPPGRVYAALNERDLLDGTESPAAVAASRIRRITEEHTHAAAV